MGGHPGKKNFFIKGVGFYPPQKKTRGGDPFKKPGEGFFFFFPKNPGGARENLGPPPLLERGGPLGSGPAGGQPPRFFKRVKRVPPTRRKNPDFPFRGIKMLPFPGVKPDFSWNSFGGPTLQILCRGHFGGRSAERWREHAARRQIRFALICARYLSEWARPFWDSMPPCCPTSRPA